jgi:hypothetical protein
MSTINGLPAHVLLVHLVVVLAPLTAVLAMLCALWPAARERLVWLVLVLALITAGVTPLTTEAGEWLEHRLGETPAIEAHAERGDVEIYFVLGLLVAAALLAFLHVRKLRGGNISRGLSIAVTIVVLAAGVATIVQTYRVGDSGAQASWADALGG